MFAIVRCPEITAREQQGRPFSPKTNPLESAELAEVGVSAFDHHPLFATTHTRLWIIRIARERRAGPRSWSDSL